MKTADLHCDTLLECTLHHKELRQNDLHVDAEKLKNGGAMLQCFAIWLMTHEEAGRENAPAPYDYFYLMEATFRRELEKNADILAPAKTYAEIMKNEKTGKVTALLTAEDLGVFLDGKPERMDEAFAAGVRIMAPLWNYENCFGYPNSADPAVMEKGLKPFGLEMLERAEILGIVVDVSHLNDGGFWDIVTNAKKPFIASHSDCRALSDMPRCLSDDMLRALADKGGVSGVNYFRPFLKKDGTNPVTFSLAADHVMHMLDVGGEDLPALGSDYDGIGDTELEWKDASGTQGLFRELEKRGVSERVREKIACKNVLRVLRDCLPL